MKLKFLIRLSKNELTLDLLEFQVNMKYSGSLVEEIAGDDYDLENLIEESEIKIKELKAVKKPTSDMYNENRVNLLRSIFNTKNRFIIPDKLLYNKDRIYKNKSLKEVLINKKKKIINKKKPKTISTYDYD
jgi:hypothetical protein